MRKKYRKNFSLSYFWVGKEEYEGYGEVIVAIASNVLSDCLVDVEATRKEILKDHDDYQSLIILNISEVR